MYWSDETARSSLLWILSNAIVSSLIVNSLKNFYLFQFVFDHCWCVREKSFLPVGLTVYLSTYQEKYSFPCWVCSVRCPLLSQRMGHVCSKWPKCAFMAFCGENGAFSPVLRPSWGEQPQKVEKEANCLTNRKIKIEKEFVEAFLLALAHLYNLLWPFTVLCCVLKSKSFVSSAPPL